MLAEDLGELSGGENKDDYKAGYERLLSWILVYKLIGMYLCSSNSLLKNVLDL
jgi:hypothetical protein